ncbi:bifunctional ribokinase/ribose-5-phosphate isomerase A-like [Athalia rosae]|uniref:bifunctional ribokinase/ribose-5-phosphate isomerase A-like n=1 Tax=Athalia rosae TaxID=37344 RepID=UPI0020331E6D|nr:bifunctional ribokinase/ribose-5-phosphate isomerase A-like [Athalia rosae]
MPEVVVLGSCMVDFSCYSSRFPKAGETLCGKRFAMSNGGKGANQCVAAARLGSSTALIASLGADSFGREYLEKLKLENVDISKVHLRDGIHSGIAQITVTDSGENSIIIVPGANTLLSPEDVNDAQELIKNAKVLLCQFETPLSSTLQALKMFKGRGLSILNGAPAIQNPDPELLRSCDIFCINETEAEMMTGVHISGLFEAQIAVNELLNQGCNAVLLTLGALGAVYASTNSRNVIHVPTAEVTPIDTTGAGDAFLGSFAYFAAYHTNLSIAEIVKKACYVASQTVIKIGTQSSFPFRKDLPADLFAQLRLFCCDNMPDVVVVGAYVADFTCFAPRFAKAGETVVCEKFITSHGGKGANQLVCVARLGGSTGFVSSLGADCFGRDYIEQLKVENVDVSHVHIREGKSSATSLITVAQSGENTIMYVAGASTLLTPEDVENATELIKSAKVLLCQFEIPPAPTLRALQIYKGSGLSILNGAPAQQNIDPELLKLCDIFCVNETETEILTGIVVTKLCGAQDAVNELLSRGCNAVILTLGAHGAVYASKENKNIIHVLAEQVKAIDTTGAGDAFLGAFAYFAAYHPDLPIEEKLKRACYIASQTVLRIGTQSNFPYQKELPAKFFVD